MYHHGKIIKRRTHKINNPSALITENHVARVKTLLSRDKLNRLNLFEALIFGIYGNWLISFVDKISFEKTIMGLWFYQHIAVALAFILLIALFASSIFKPFVVTKWYAWALGFGHGSMIYVALWSENFTSKTGFFFWIGFSLFCFIYLIELRRASIMTKPQIT